MIKFTILKKLLLTLGCLPLLICLIFRFFFFGNLPCIFRDNSVGLTFLGLSLILYILICILLSKRARKYFFSSNQQLYHNRMLFSVVYPFLYIWYIDDRLVDDKINKGGNTNR